MDFFISNSWWEPGSAGFDVGDATALLIFIITLVGIIRSVTKWWVKQVRSVVNDELTKATTLIHPNANGGLSLPDVARKVHKIEDTLVQMKMDNLELKDLIVTHIIKKETSKAKRNRSDKSA